MKRNSLFYWILTGMLGALMLLASIPDVLRSPEAVAVFQHLGFPAYLLPFLGTAKILGVAAILIPGFQRLKEWAYAGLTFDLVGALYSHLSVRDPITVWGFALCGLALLASSYVFYRKQMVMR